MMVQAHGRPPDVDPDPYPCRACTIIDSCFRNIGSCATACATDGTPCLVSKIAVSTVVHGRTITQVHSPMFGAQQHG